MIWEEGLWAVPSWAMRILVVGSGGREHALAWKLAQEHEVFCAPGNPGIAEDVEIVPVVAMDLGGLLEVALKRKVDLVVVGPEDPLVAGLADVLGGAGVPCYGPGLQAARLEGSKAFSKAAMAAAGVPTAEFASSTSAEMALEYARQRFAAGRQVAVKASGNALGKGVVVCERLEEAEGAIRRMMVDREFGDAGAEVVVEDRLVGREFSLLTIVGDGGFASLPVAQDHKRAFDGDLGPNTGGMGTVSPCEWVSDDLIKETEARVVAPLLAEMRRRGIPYRGTLFSGLMVEEGTPYCLEYNVRFGDPETQSVMLRLGRGLGEALYSAAIGDLVSAPEVLDNAAATVVVASGGYPGGYERGLPIEIDALPDGAKLFHAGTALRNGELVTSGGRVIGASASGATLDEARLKAYAAAEAVRFEGAFFRRDIGAIA